MALPAPSRTDGDAPVAALSRGRLADVLTDTLAALERLELPLATTDVHAARARRDRLIDQLRDQVLPRLADADAPAVVVVGGSTGAGKSTLVNSVLGTEVSEAGILRPTTRTPVLVINPEDAATLDGHPVADVCRTLTSDVVPAGLALVDASDLDSVHVGNRRLAARLLEAADLWLFVTTAARYGDHTPWASLEEAAGRGTPVGVVLNRVPDGSLRVVRRDLMERLEALGLADAPFFVVMDAGPTEGLLPAESVAELREWLRALAGRHRASGLLSRTGRSTWAAVRTDLADLADAVDAQGEAADALAAALSDLPAEHLAVLREEVDSGRLAEGAPSTRWVALASSGGPLAALAQGQRLRRGLLGRAGRARAGALASVADEARTTLTARLDAVLSVVGGEAERLRADAVADADTVGRRATADDAVVAAGAAAALSAVAPDATASDATAAAGRTASAGAPTDRPASAAADDETLARRTVAAWADAVDLPETAQASTALGGQAARDLVVAAAIGVDGTRAAAARLGLEPAVTAARGALNAALERAVVAVAGPDAAPAAPDPSLAASLRLRAGELAPLTRPGATA